MQEDSVLYLSPEAYAHFKSVIDDPGPPHPNLIKLVKTIQSITIVSFDREMIKEMCALILIDDKGFETAFNEVIPEGYVVSDRLIGALDYANDEDDLAQYNLTEFIGYLQEHKLIDEEDTVAVNSSSLTEERANAIKDAAINLVGSAKAYVDDETDFFPWKENVIRALALTKAFPKELGDDKSLADLIDKTLQLIESNE